MSAHDFRNLEAEDLRAKVGALREDLFHVRFQHATAQLSDTSQVRKARRMLACALTILREQELARKAASAAEEA